MAVDWLRIKSEYVNGNISYRELSEKYGVSQSAIRKKAASEKWTGTKIEQLNRIETKIEQKTEEKIADALSDEAAAKIRIKASMMRLAEGWFAKQERIIAEDPTEKAIDPNDFRKMVQSCVDLGIMEEQHNTAVEDDGLLAALGESVSSLFDEGDDSGMVSDVDNK